MASATPSGKRRPLPTTADERLAEGERLKSEGNAAFKAGRYKQARVLYAKVFAFTRGLDQEQDSSGAGGGEASMAMQMAKGKQIALTMEQDDRMVTLTSSASLNMAACMLKLEQPRKSLEHCHKVLKQCSLEDGDEEEGGGGAQAAAEDGTSGGGHSDPARKRGRLPAEAATKLATKANFRCGQAYLSMGDLDKARHHLDAAAALTPGDKAIEAERRRLLKRFAQHERQERKRWAGAFGSLAAPPAAAADSGTPAGVVSAMGVSEAQLEQDRRRNEDIDGEDEAET
eukprot:g5278.t1